jgi:hypothetical protein
VPWVLMKESGETSFEGRLHKAMAQHDTFREIVHTVGRIGRALLAHQEGNQELHDLAVEVRWLEAEIDAPREKLARVGKSYISR